jgi:hypothetical protein
MLDRATGVQLPSPQPSPPKNVVRTEREQTADAALSATRSKTDGGGFVIELVTHRF